MKSPVSRFLPLLTVLIAEPYMFGVRPKTRREWIYIGLTIGFIAWMLILMAPLRST